MNEMNVMNEIDEEYEDEVIVDIPTETIPFDEVFTLFQKIKNYCNNFALNMFDKYNSINYLYNALNNPN